MAWSLGRTRTPSGSRLKTQITICLGEDVLDYFKGLAAETGMPYQRLIDLYLRDCMISERKLAMRWEDRAES